ncbi:hypothetical protein LP414_09585 [Polaromonas sp. P1(28)-13]|nr:hypothetical protein LP414_09585 [Polaromonas sp. P1(28)-13]
MATIENRSRYCVSVKNRDDLTRRFPFTQESEATAYRDSLRDKRLKPNLTQEEDQFFVRIRQKGYPKLQMSFDSRDRADEFCKQIEVERGRGLFRDYTKSHHVTFADLMVRFLLKEAPKHKSFQMQAYKLEGWLEDSESHGLDLLERYRTALRDSGKPVRDAKFKMRETCSSLLWIHKRLPEVATTDIEDFITERLLSVAPATVDRELDILRSIFTVATKVWGFNLDTNPMDGVRRPKYFNRTRTAHQPGRGGPPD